MKITFIRHLKTKGNLEKRYIGITDEPICEEGKRDILTNYPKANIIFSSPKLRCVQTAKLIDDKAKIIVIEDLREIDFGDFENKTYEDLKDNSDYIDFINSNGTAKIPNGEDTDDFKKRCCDGFLQAIDILEKSLEDNAIIVCHGGTIMAICEKYDVQNKGFYGYMIKNGQGYETKFDAQSKRLSIIKELRKPL